MGIVKVNSNMVYETFFSMLHKDSFDPMNIRTDLSCHSSINKPEKAWWGSPVNAEFGWREWCEREEFGSYDFDSDPIRWGLKNDEYILVIDMDDVTKNIDKDVNPIDNPIVHYTNDKGWIKYLNYQEMYNDGIVAVELKDASIGHLFINEYERMFNSWDCQSIVVLDPTKIIWY